MDTLSLQLSGFRAYLRQWEKTGVTFAAPALIAMGALFDGFEQQAQEMEARLSAPFPNYATLCKKIAEETQAVLAISDEMRRAEEDLRAKDKIKNKIKDKIVPFPRANRTGEEGGAA